MKKFSKKAIAAFDREELQVINNDVWLGIQDPMKLRCEFYWLDEYDNQITVEVPLYNLRRAIVKIEHDCCINLVCPTGAFIPSAIQVDDNRCITLEPLCEDLIQNCDFNDNIKAETSYIITRSEYVEVTNRILAAID